MKCLTGLGGFEAFGGEGDGLARGGEETWLACAWVWAERSNNRFFRGATRDDTPTEEDDSTGVMGELAKAGETLSTGLDEEIFPKISL